MDLPNASRGQAKRFAEEWASVFSNPQVDACAHENKPFWIRPGQEVLPSTSTELLKTLMQDLCDDSDPFLYQADVLEGFCLPADLSILKRGNDQRVGRPVALLDDRNDEGTRIAVRGTCRPRKGALTAHQLYVELSKAVSGL
jgi:hypothetical protein